jgi:electron transfer flavoprotein beta subunit
MAQVTYVQSLRVEGNSIIVDRALEDGYETIEVNTPVLLTAIKELNTPRYMSMNGIFTAFKEKEIKVLGIKDIGLDPALTGLTGSPTQVRKSFTPEPKGKGEILNGSVKEMSDQLVIKLKQKHLI